MITLPSSKTLDSNKWLAEIYLILTFEKISMQMEPQDMKWGIPHVPSEELNLKPERLISHKCLIYWRQSLIFWPTSIRQESLPLLKPMNWLLELWLDWPLFVLLAHKYRPPPNLKELVCSLLQHGFPNCNFSSITPQNSISGNLDLPWFTFWFRLTYLRR